MSLRAQIQRLQRDVEWLRWWGRLRAVEQRMKIREIQRAMEKAQAASAMVRRPPRPVPAPPVPPPMAKPPPLHREASTPAPPPKPPPPPPPDPAIHPYDPPEHMQIRPTQWRVPGPADYHDDAAAGTNGQCIVDYDPLADGDDDP